MVNEVVTLVVTGWGDDEWYLLREMRGFFPNWDSNFWRSAVSVSSYVSPGFFFFDVFFVRGGKKLEREREGKKF